MKRKILLIPTTSLMLFSSSCANTKIETKTYEVLTFQPFYNEPHDIKPTKGWELPTGFGEYKELIVGAGKALENSTNNVTCNFSSKDDYLNSELFKKLGKNQIILFDGHGSFTQISDGDPYFYSVMWTGRNYVESEISDVDKDNYNLIQTDFYHKHWLRTLLNNMLEIWRAQLFI